MRTEATGVRGQGPARLALLAAMMMVVPHTFAQQAPLTPPPQILLIGREFIKPGKRAEVLRIERDSVEQQVRLKSPHSYLTISSMSGREDLWWLNPADSYGDFEKELAKVTEVIRVLNSATARLWGEFRRTALALRAYRTSTPGAKPEKKLKLFKMAQ